MPAPDDAGAGRRTDPAIDDGPEPIEHVESAEDAEVADDAEVDEDAEPVEDGDLFMPPEADRPEPHWLNLPNALTFLRALLVPVILWLLVQDEDGDTLRWWAFGVFLFAAWTDSIDGWFARRFQGVTRWGQLADPLADKLLIIGALASLAYVGELPWWAVSVIVARELAVTLLRVQLIRRRDLVMAASVWGKAKTVSQVVAVAAYLWPTIGATVREVLLQVAIVLTIWSGIDYAFRAGRLARSRSGPAAPLSRRTR